MTMQQYVANRIISLCEERRMPINQLAHLSAIPPSTLKSIINGASKNPGILTIKLICDGHGISIYEFFNTDDFKTLTIEDI